MNGPKTGPKLPGGDGHANQGSGHLQPGFRPEPKIVYFWGLNGPDRLPNPSKKVEGEALHLFGGVWRSIGLVSTPNLNDFRLRPEPWLQMARTLVSVAVASGQFGTGFRSAHTTCRGRTVPKLVRHRPLAIKGVGALVPPQIYWPWAMWPCELYPMLRSASGPEIGLPGRISAGFLSRRTSASALRPAEGPILRLSLPRNPAGIRPGSLISGPEAPLHNIT